MSKCKLCDTLRNDADDGDECVVCGAVYLDMHPKRPLASFDHMSKRAESLNLPIEARLGGTQGRALLRSMALPPYRPAHSFNGHSGTYKLREGATLYYPSDRAHARVTAPLRRRKDAKD